LYRKIVSATYVLNIVFQAFFTLAMPAGLGFLASWLLVSFAGAPGWVYAPFLIFGVLIGLVLMVKFIISSMAALESLEKQQKAESNEKRTADKRRDALASELKELKDALGEDCSSEKNNSSAKSAKEESPKE